MDDKYLVFTGHLGIIVVKRTVAAVKENSLSVAALMDTRHEVTFKKDHSYVWH